MKDEKQPPFEAHDAEGSNMEKQRQVMNSVIVFKTHYDLPKVTEQEARANGAQAFLNADQGIQTAVVAKDGMSISAVIGLNGVRYLPDPDPDPLDEIVRLALAAARAERK